ncbi:uncharacterized protein si:dkey-200l5.4 isoform X2 [Danio aesculapii]|uniref:uncharacterized protein si:dkey-200l5.4 isoform X2 n=1 Tax=Danio aesculapii TaxID=1142201 RepID=UPI0024C00BA3|nr:uncharacterized protein si:dkey-200l5.4 isoform X2 [Danio aesculapii]
MCDSMRTLTLSLKHLFQLVRHPPLSYKMRTGVPIILFVAVAGFHNVISLSLESDESNESSEEREYAENSTTPQTDESQYAAAHVKDGLIKTTRMDGETEAVSNDTDEYAAAHVKDGETEAGSEDTEERNDKDSKESKVLENEDDDGETGELTHNTGANTGSDESVADSEEDKNDFDYDRFYY